ncbi:protein of unknown function [Tenacibaculum sp. 190130A14a]|uniref:Cysteine-rich CPCC domain-containing protein n=1 Tax=Tenacibaculum polynesiense TaxID=3137857 RepID=A0ABM9PFN3_9FLAO
MNRKEVIEKYISLIIEGYSEDKREEEITQLLLENWSNVQGWTNLPDNLQKEFNNGKLDGNFNDKKYNDILKFKLHNDIKGYNNEYLSEATGIIITRGNACDLIACPCCGYKTLESRNEFDICKICWWEDDGQDNEQADDILRYNWNVNFDNYLVFSIHKTT